MAAWIQKQARPRQWRTHREGDRLVIGLAEISYVDYKPDAVIFIDDRGYRFEGNNFPTAEQILNLHPWNRQANGEPRTLHDGVPCEFE